MDEIRTRLATVDDVDAMIAVFTAGLETYREFAPENWAPPEPDRNQTREVLAHPSTWAMLALVDGEPVGHVSFAPARERSSGDSPGPWVERPLIPGLVHLWQLFVLSPWWGSGIAAELHDAGTAEMRVRGYEHARLFTPSGQARARRFYERRGWIAVDEQDNPGFGLPLVEYRLELRSPG